MSQEINRGLQVFRRGIAAKAVVMHHAAISTDAFVKTVLADWPHACDASAYGVDIFFMLPVSIAMHAHTQ